MSDYEALTRRLTELTEKAKAGVPHCTTYAHEYAAVALAAVELSKRGIDHQANGECLACKMRVRLDALQAAMR